MGAGRVREQVQAKYSELGSAVYADYVRDT